MNVLMTKIFDLCLYPFSRINNIVFLVPVGVLVGVALFGLTFKLIRGNYR